LGELNVNFAGYIPGGRTGRGRRCTETVQVARRSAAAMTSKQVAILRYIELYE
jgi:hypothetical protein